MSSEKPNFLSQPVVKNIYVFRNGDPYYEARRIVINQKRVSNFETLLREVTGGIQPPFGAVRTIYTPRGGHKVDSLENLKSGEQYVAAGREKFKKMDYLKIGSRRKRMLQTHPAQAKPLLQNRIIVSARFLKPIKEPCTIFAVANGDVLNPAMRLLIHQRMLSQFDRILEMITEKMGLRVLGGVRSLYTYEGTQVHDGNQLESGQLYVAVGRERFKKLPYNDLLFTKARGTRRVNGMKAYSLPPIYRFSKQNGNSKSVVNSSDSTDTRDSKASPPRRDSSKKEHLSAIVREISQARLISLRKKRSRQSMTLSVSDNADLESKADERSTQDKAPQDLPGEEEPTEDDTKAEESTENTVEKEEEEEAPVTAENNTEEDAPDSKKESEENQEISDEKEEGEEKKENDEQHDREEGEVTVGAEQNEEDGGEEEDVKREEQESSSNSSDKTQNDKEEENGSNSSSMPEKDEQEENIVEEKQDKDSREAEESSEELVTGVGDGEEQQEEDSGDGHEKTLSDMETKENSSNSDQEDVSAREDRATKESGEAETTANGAVSDVEEGEKSDTEQGVQEKNAARATANTEKVADDEQETKVSE